MDFHGCNDRQGHRLREGTSTEGGDEGDGTRQCSTLGVMVHHQLCHDARLRAAACHCTQGSIG